MTVESQIRTITNMNTFVIARYHQGSRWVLFNVDNRQENLKQVLWTRNKFDAIHFSTIKEAEEIVSKYLPDRTNLAVIRLADA